MHEAHKMAAFSRVALLLLICWIQHCSTQNTPPSTLNISPSKIQLTSNTTSTGTTVTVTCGPPSGVGSITLLALSIRRQQLGSQTSTELTKAVAGQNNNQPQPVNPLTGATASGSLGERLIKLVMTQAKCGDQGTYICEALYSSSSGTPKATSEAYLKADVTPGQLELTATTNKQLWSVNETMTLSCNGHVGSVNDTGGTYDPEIIWHWEYKSSGQSWQTYDGPSGDIGTGSLGGITTCSRTQTSTLTRHLSLDDSGRTYRCYMQRGIHSYTEFADERYVGTVTDGTTPPTGSTEESIPAEVGPIIGGVFGALIVIAVIVIIIYFLVIRPRRRKQAEENVDGGAEKGGDNEAVPPYTETADPAVVYTQPRRGKDKNKKPQHSGLPAGTEGVDNKALDESAEKHAPNDSKLPSDNDDRRHGRRHRDKKSPPTSYEADPRRQDYDPDYAKLDRGSREPRQGHRADPEEKPQDRPRRHHDDGRANDDNRRGRRPREADDYDQKPRHDDNYGPGRRNRGYEPDNRRRGHHSSSEDGGTDGSYVNTSQYSMGDGDPTMGTAI